MSAVARRKLTPEQVREIREVAVGWRRWKRKTVPVSLPALARKFGVTPAAVYFVVHGLSYKEVG